MMEFLIKRLKEPSTWRGLVAIVAVLGYSMSPELVEAIAAAAIALLGAIEVFRKEKTK